MDDCTSLFMLGLEAIPLLLVLAGASPALAVLEDWARGGELSMLEDAEFPALAAVPIWKAELVTAAPVAAAACMATPVLFTPVLAAARAEMPVLVAVPAATLFTTGPVFNTDAASGHVL